MSAVLGNSFLSMSFQYVCSCFMKTNPFVYSKICLCFKVFIVLLVMNDEGDDDGDELFLWYG